MLGVCDQEQGVVKYLLVSSDAPHPVWGGGGTVELWGERRRERQLFIDNLLVRIHFIIIMIRWTGLAPWEFEFFFQVALHLPF